MESAGVRWCLLSPLDLLCGKSLVGIRRLHWNMLNSGGLPPYKTCKFGPCHTNTIRELSPAESAGIRQNMWGSVQSSFLFILSLMFIFLQSLKERKANVGKYLTGDLKDDLLNMLECLHPASMNYDITDSESSDRALQSCTHWWLSPNVISILQELDTLGKRAKASRLVSKKGNRSLPRT